MLIYFIYGNKNKEAQPNTLRSIYLGEAYFLQQQKILSIHDT
jgi:hypothetical protein